MPSFEMTQIEPEIRNPLTDPDGTGGIKGKSKTVKLREAAAAGVKLDR